MENTIKTLQKRLGNTEHKIELEYDEFVDSPREYNEHSELCIRENRSYSFPNELSITEEDFENDELLESIARERGQKLFWLDCYKHGGITFSLSGEGMQCRFDSSPECGFIIAESEKQAREEIKKYNQYINGECYRLCVSERSVIEKDGKTFYSDWEVIDAMGYIGWENLGAPSQFPFEEGEWEEFIS